MDKNHQYWGNGDRNDVAISYEDYLEILYSLHDERLSPEAVMRFKNLREVNIFGMAYVPLYCSPFAIALTHFIMGPTRKSHAHYRLFWPLLSLTLPITCWVGYTLPLPRKLYTDILAADNMDGTYVRQRIKQMKPGLWRKISRQLFQKNWNFPEMNEYTQSTEFPLDYVNPHKF